MSINPLPEKFGLEVEKNVRLQNKLSVFVLQLKGQVLDFCYWPSITEGETCSSRNANQRGRQKGQFSVVQCSAMQCNPVHCQMLAAKICNGGKRVGAGVRSGGGGAGTLEFILLSQKH